MVQIQIAELNPGLPARASKQFKAAVTLIWPYSSSQRQFALLLAEPDLRLRRKKGQVRARFYGSSARALATTGVGIGDEVILSLKGAQFVQEGIVSTPGRSIDWELEYMQTVSVQVFRHGNEVANFELTDAAPTPAPLSPVRRGPTAVSSSVHSAHQWSSPAFMKRLRLSDGPLFEAPYNPLADGQEEGHDRKRRRKSYRDWKAWTYSARTPSPDKEDVGEEACEDLEASPSRPTQLPHTPISPSKSGILSAARGLTHQSSEEDQDQQANVGNELGSRTTAERLNKRGFVEVEQYDDLYAGPNDIPPSDAQYAFGGDTEVNTEEDDALEDTEGVSMSATEVNTEDPEDCQFYTDEEGRSDSASIAHEQRPDTPNSESSMENSLAEIEGNPQVLNMTSPRVEHDDEEFSVVELTGASSNTPIIVMPPPNLLALDTNFETHATLATPGLLTTPIGREPASPTLQPLDSATLPLPSPFPGERDATTTSYLDHVAHDQPSVDAQEPKDADQEPPSDADYIMETSFFSSISSSKAPAIPPNHETAFTPVRFSFGLDGAGFSRPREPSSPAPGSPKKETISTPPAAVDTPSRTRHETSAEGDPDAVLSADDDEASGPSPAGEADTGFTSKKIVETISPSPVVDVAQAPSTNVPEHKSAVVELLSDSEEGSEQSEDDEDELEEEGEEEDSEGESDFAEDLDEGLTDEEDYSNEEQGSSPKQMYDGHQKQAALETAQSQDHVEAAIAEMSAAASEIIGFDITPGNETNAQDHDTAMAESADVSLSTHPVTVDYMDTYPGIMQANNEFLELDAASEFLDFGSDPHSTVFDQHELLIESKLQSPIDHMDVDMRQIDPMHMPQDGLTHMEQHDPNIKVESIEEDISAHLRIPNQQSKAAQLDTGAGESDQILIEVPEEGDKVGILQTIAVPATAPARNTRSKTKTSVSLTKNETETPKRMMRSTRSKAFDTRWSISPPRMRTGPTQSPAQESTSTPPYQLRSQSKLLSPTMETKPPSATRRSPRKHASLKSVESIPDASHSQLDDKDAFLTGFDSSQILNMSQGRYSNVSFVKDSEEDSLHSEHSISTNKYSDEWNVFTNFSDPVVGNEQDHEPASLKLPPSTAPEPRSGTGAKAKWKQSGGQIFIPKSSPTNPNLSDKMQRVSSSPGRRLRSASSAASREASSSPRVVRTTRRRVYNISSSPPPSTDDLEDQITPRVSQFKHQGEDEIRSSPPAVSVPNRKSHSLAMDSNKPITPDATQRTYIGSQPEPPSAQQQTLPMTPHLTQVTSGLQNALAESITQTTPRRNMTGTDVASPLTSPKENSPDVSSDTDPMAAGAPEHDQPTIGLSTPIAYYTPLNSLTYFLNRSPQFHTASNPDILALVTSSTTPPQRASKGPKHWNTTFHITDFSTWPTTTTTVNIFRAYQTALPTADAGDIILLRAFAVKSLNRHPTLVSADESAWCVWRYSKPVWGTSKRNAYAEVRAREEVKGPEVERGEGEWREVDKLRRWFERGVRGELEERGKRTRAGRDGVEDENVAVDGEQSGVVGHGHMTTSQDHG